MPKGGAIPPAERRSWLERYEAGASTDAIAKEAGRTQRTVVTQLARARQERQHDQVQVDLIRDAYRRHYQDLLEMAVRLAERCDKPNSLGILPEPGLEPDFRMLYEGLHSHAPSSRLWSGVTTWEESSKRLAMEWEQTGAQIAILIKQPVAGVPEISNAGFAESLRDAVMMVAQGRNLAVIDYRRDASGGTRQLRWGSFILADGVQSDDRLGEIEIRHRELLEDALKLNPASQLKTIWSRWSEARDVIQEEVRTLRLRRVLTGQCNLCPGGEGSGVRRYRKRRGDG